MSRHSEGQHNRKLYKIVSKPDEIPNQVGSGEEPSLSNGWQSEQIKQTNSRHQIHATNGTKPANFKEIRGGKQETNSLTNSKPSSFLDQHLTEKSTDRGSSTHEILGHNIERLKEVVKRRLLRPSKARKSANTRLRVSSSANDLSSYALTSGLAGSSNPGRQCHAYVTKVRYLTCTLLILNSQ